MAGIIYCYDTTNGDLLWTFGNGGVPGNDTNSGFQVPGPYPTFVYAVCNGVVYTMTTEHTVETPIYKNARTRAINATDGTEIWTFSTITAPNSAAIADGFATFFAAMMTKFMS
jgi:outer membrane protein assembly factor BamB